MLQYREEGHYANKCPIRGKINELDIDQELKNQLLRLALIDSEQSSEGEILEVQDESDSYSSTKYESRQEGKRTCEGCIIVYTKDQEILLEVVEKVQDPEIQQKITQRLRDAMTISKPPEREERNPYRLQSVLQRFEKPRELTTQDQQREINNLKQEVQALNLKPGQNPICFAKKFSIFRNGCLNERKRRNQTWTRMTFKVPSLEPSPLLNTKNGTLSLP